MNLIYEPKGKAREYSPLALNIYSTCDHGCKYCYAKFFTPNEKPKPRKNIVLELEKVANKFRNGKQVLLCFTCDAYCNEDVKHKTTRDILKVLLKNQVTTAILTKGGKRCLRDIDLFKKFHNIKVGATLTSLDNSTSINAEPYAALPDDRISTLKVLYENGIKTWVSLEPVIAPAQVYDIIKKTHTFINQFKVGKLNHSKKEHLIDWKDFCLKSITLLRKLKKDFYVKKDLAKFAPEGFLTKEETDEDNLFLKPFNEVLF